MVFEQWCDMPYKKQIEKVTSNFQGLNDPDRIGVLNSQLVQLNEAGLGTLASNFLANNNPYTLIPFLFELYIGRWILTLNNAKDCCYEPQDLNQPPDFRLKIDGALLHIEAKTILQTVNEMVKKKIVKQINERISSKTTNIIEIWLSEDIDAKDLNSTVDWIAEKAVQISIGEKKVYVVDEDIMAWVRVVAQNETEGSIGIEHISGTSNGLAREIDVSAIREKIRVKMKKANRKFDQCSNGTAYNFLILTCDSRIPN